MRNRLYKSKEKIAIQDFGAGSRNTKSPIRKVSEIAKSSGSNKQKAEILFKLVNHFQANTILELGTNLGIGTSYLASANSKSMVHSLEGDPQLYNLAKAHFNFLDLKNIKTYLGNFDNTLDDVLSTVKDIDLVFLDGNHQEIPTIAYYTKVFKKLSPMGIVVIDDIHWSKGMENAWTKILAMNKHSFSIDMFNFGILIFGYSRKESLDINFISYKYKPWKIGLFG